MLLGSVLSSLSRIMQRNDVELLAVLIATVYGVIVLVRVFGIMRKTECPECGHKVTRKKREAGDYILKMLTLFIIPIRRYKCVHCGWEGLRWNVEKRIKKEPRP